MPIGAYGASKEIMSHLFPIGKVYQAGTFSGNPVTMAGAIETIKLLSDSQILANLESNSARFFSGLNASVDRIGLPVQLQRVGSMFHIAFAPNRIKNYSDSLSIDSKAYAQFFHHLLQVGVYMPPSAADAACVSAAHSEEEIDFTIEVCERAFKDIAASL
jgi:glutamate-1-semialdehyde 2,1-aminomutase